MGGSSVKRRNRVSLFVARDDDRQNDFGNTIDGYYAVAEKDHDLFRGIDGRVAGDVRFCADNGLADVLKRFVKRPMTSYEVILDLKPGEATPHKLD